MKKRIVSLVVAALLSVATAVSAFATSEFQLSIFQETDDYAISIDEMTGTAQVMVQSLLDGEGVIDFGDAYVDILPMVSSYPELDTFVIGFSYFGDHWENIDQIIIKIGNQSYFFSNFSVYAKAQQILDTMVQETVLIAINSETVSFMQNLIENRDSEIKVRLVGMYRNLDFILTQGIKDGLIGLYDRYVMAGGTRESNLKKITEGGKFFDLEVKDITFQ